MSRSNSSRAPEIGAGPSPRSFTRYLRRFCEYAARHEAAERIQSTPSKLAGGAAHGRKRDKPEEKNFEYGTTHSAFRLVTIPGLSCPAPTAAAAPDQRSTFDTRRLARGGSVAHGSRQRAPGFNVILQAATRRIGDRSYNGLLNASRQRRRLRGSPVKGRAARCPHRRRPRTSSTTTPISVQRRPRRRKAGHLPRDPQRTPAAATLASSTRRAEIGRRFKASGPRASSSRGVSTSTSPLRALAQARASCARAVISRFVARSWWRLPRQVAQHGDCMNVDFPDRDSSRRSLA